MFFFVCLVLVEMIRGQPRTNKHKKLDEKSRAKHTKPALRFYLEAWILGFLVFVLLAPMVFGLSSMFLLPFGFGGLGVTLGNFYQNQTQTIRVKQHKLKNKKQNEF